MRRHQVLVVDPNPTTLSRVESAFLGSAYSILSARDAVEAEDRANGQDISLILSSTGLPRGNGYDLARTLLADHPDAKVFLMSGGFEVYNRTRAEQAGVMGRISKPFSADGLRARLESVLGPFQLEASDGDDFYAPSSTAGPNADSPEPPASLEIDLTDPIRPMDPQASSYSAPLEEERVATIVPRDYQQTPAAGASVASLEPAVEAAVLEVLPEVVEAVLRRTLQTSTAFRDLIEVAVDEAVRAHLPAIARRVIRERIAEIEAYDD
jgi:CheY-like chemotaxis protein